MMIPLSGASSFTVISSAGAGRFRGSSLGPDSLTDPLVCLLDLGSNYSTSNGLFQLTFNAAGICTITAS